MEEKQNYISSLAFFASALCILIIISIIHFLVPDTLDVNYIIANFTPPLSDFVAEKSEKLQYMISVIAYPFIFFGFYFFFKKIIENFNEKFYKFIMLFEIALGTMIFILSTAFSIGVKEIYHLDFIHPVIQFFGILILFLGLYLYNKKEKYKKLITLASFIMGAVFIYQTFNFYDIKSLAFMDISLHHFEAYFYPIYKTISGMTPGVDFRNLYGFYPYIYSIFFNLDNISIPKIAMFNCILMTLSVAFFMGIVYKNIKNKVIAFTALASSMLLCLLHCFYIYTLHYYQYMPHRIFFVMLITFLITVYLNIKNEKIKTVLEYLGYIISSVSVFWNLESGIAALAGWGSMFFYLSLYKENKLKNISLVFLKVILSFVFAFLAIFIVTYIHSGHIINPLNLFFGQFVFYKYGFYMLKMNPLEQPFLLVIIPYLIALSNSIKNAVENNFSKIDVIKFTLSVIGFAVFIYFQGRSHILCLTAVLWPACIIVGILTEEYYLKYLEYKNKNKFISKISLVKFVLLFFLSSLYALQALFFINTMPNTFNRYKNKILTDSSQIQNLKILDKNQEYDFLTKDASFYYMTLKQPDLKPFSHPVDCFLKSDIKKITEYLKTSNKKLVLDDYTTQNLDMDYIYKNYLLEKTNGNIYVLRHK